MYHCFPACHIILNLDWNVQQQIIRYVDLLVLICIRLLKDESMGKLVLNFLPTMFNYLFAYCCVQQAFA
jgi:hypothetical protein